MKEVSQFSEREAQENCALFAVVLETPDKNIHQLTAQALDAQQHRGETAAGIAWAYKNSVREIKGIGLRPQAAPVENHPELPRVKSEIGHERYPTKGKKNPNEILLNTQPFRFRDPERPHDFSFAIAHNGTVEPLDNFAEGDPTSDTYSVGKEINLGNGNFIDNTINVLEKLRGAYRFVFVTADERIFVGSDSLGFRPALHARIEKNGFTGRVVASETVGLRAIGATSIQEIPRGTFAEVLPEGLNIIWRDPRAELYPEARCTFESMYFADAVSESVPGVTNHMLRVEGGRELVRNSGIMYADLVSPVPNSGWSFAEGGALESGLPLRQAIHINRYRGRNFIKARETPEERKQDSLLKYRFIPELINGKNLAIFDDSIVRGFTQQGLILALFDQGAANIEVFIGVPIIKENCYWGIDFPDKFELIYNQLMAIDDRLPFERKLALWLVDGNIDLANRLRISFQTLEAYKRMLGPNGCYHCVDGVIPPGAERGKPHPYS